VRSLSLHDAGQRLRQVHAPIALCGSYVETNRKFIDVEAPVLDFERLCIYSIKERTVGVEMVVRKVVKHTAKELTK
jgi:hypothetical protein